jgi:predicted phage terminase large subunit-like protein
MATLQRPNISNIDELINRALSTHNFWEFCLYYDHDFFTRRQFLKEVASAFQRVYENYQQGKAIKVAVSMPPRAGKSYITSLFCAWWLGKFPDLSVMRNACTARLYQKFSYDVRNVVKSDRFRSVFPAIALAPDKQNVDGWNLTTSRQVGYFGAGVGGTIIGFGANIAITDDLYKDMEAALSEKVQEGVAMWKQSAHNSRMERACPEIYIGTRWTLKDEIGKAIESGDVDIVVKIPALVVGPDGQLRSFCEDVKTTAEYLKIKADTEESIWIAEYMQEPAEIEGLLFPAGLLKYFSPDQLKDAEYKYMAIDPADTGGDDLSAPLGELHGDGIFITDALYNKFGTDVNIPAVVEMIITHRVNHTDIESNAAWLMFTKQVKAKVAERDPNRDIRAINAKGNKQTRILAQSAFIINHFYFLKEQYWTPQYRAFMKNLTTYMRAGTSKHEDSADSLAMMAKYYQKTFSKLW